MTGHRSLAGEADAFAGNLMPIIESRSAVRNLRGLAAALNERGVRSPRGRWHMSTSRT